MKLSNRGFAISTMLYGTLILAFLVVLFFISIMSTNRNLSSSLVASIKDDLNRYGLTHAKFSYIDSQKETSPGYNGQEFYVPKSGWYLIELWGAQSQSSLGTYSSGIVFLPKDSLLYFYIGSANTNGSYNGGNTDVRQGVPLEIKIDDKNSYTSLVSAPANDSKSQERIIMRASSGTGNPHSYISTATGTNNIATYKFNNRDYHYIFYNPVLYGKVNSGDGRASIKLVSEKDITDIPAASTPDQKIPDGTYYISLSSSSNKVLMSDTIGTFTIKSALFNGFNNQKWIVTSSESNYEIVNVSTGLALVQTGNTLQSVAASQASFVWKIAKVSGSNFYTITTSGYSLNDSSGTINLSNSSLSSNNYFGFRVAGEVTKILANDSTDDTTNNTAVDTLIAKANPITNTEYMTSTVEQKQQMYTFNHVAGAQQYGWSPTELVDYRYIGANPNNYVKFNDELWRIIGVFTVENNDGSRSQKIKIIRESIGNYSWDSSSSSVNSGFGVNEWSVSDAMNLLNNGAYWNRISGNCYNGKNNATTACDFSTTGLIAAAKAMISPTKYYLGGTSDFTSSTNGLASHFYGYERSNTVVSATDNVTRTTSWIGNIGLMYPSDYGYATGGGTNKNEQACLAKEIYNWRNNNGYSECYTNNWLYNSNVQLWLLTDETGDNRSVFGAVAPVGYIGNDSTFDARGIRPTLYLKSDIQIASGDGTSTSPYILK